MLKKFVSKGTEKKTPHIFFFLVVFSKLLCFLFSDHHKSSVFVHIPTVDTRAFCLKILLVLAFIFVLKLQGSNGDC